MTDMPPTTSVPATPEPPEEVYVLPDSAVLNEKREYRWSLRRSRRTRDDQAEPAAPSGQEAA